LVDGYFSRSNDDPALRRDLRSVVSAQGPEALDQ
jgi:hypothetical protein